MKSHERLLRELARDCGVQLTYRDGLKQRRTADSDAVVAILAAMGQDASTADEAADSIARRTAERWSRALEPVGVARPGHASPVVVRMPASFDGRIRFLLATEAGEEIAWHVEAASLEVVEKEDADGGSYVARRASLPAELPAGYHRLRVDAPAEAEMLVIAAPTRMHDGPRASGVFSPVYAIRGSRNWGCGDLGGLGEMIEWCASRGGSLVATLPILSAFLDELFEPSPYAPVSRLAWNEVFLDVEALPEFASSHEAQEVMRGERRTIAKLRKTDDVDYRRVHAVKRRVLEACERDLAAGRRRLLNRFLRDNPRVVEYARFRAETERRGSPWPQWSGRSSSKGSDAERFHAYAQWLMHEQLETVGRQAERDGVHLYFDLPLGVHPEGFDTWKFRDVFAFGVSGGAPPDGFFTRGQNWRFPPLHPERIRDHGYEYVIESLRALLRHARILRIDHVMGLHRLFWVPDGFDAADGLYVRSYPEEWYAILAIESHRAGAAIVGEDLGTVPREVRTSMARHGVLRSYVLQEELPDPPAPAPRPAPVRSLATLNTHDMPTFAAFWNGADIDARVELGLFDGSQADDERTHRAKVRRRLAAHLRKRRWLSRRGEPDAADALDASLSMLAASRARMRCVSIEDLWLEERQQNVPGTSSDERPNWRHKLRMSMEEIRADETVASRLERLMLP